MSGTKKWAEIKRERQANILDPIHAELDPRVWDQAASEKPVLKTQHAHWIKSKIYETLANAGYTDIQDWLTLVFTGSLTTYQYSEDSDADISLFVDTRVFPEWSRAEMIALLVHKLDGTTLPGTPFPLQDFVVGEGIKPSDLYKPGLRSGYNIDNNKWIVPPEKSRVHDVKSEQGGFYAWALQMADKMERLLRYEPDAAVQFWHQIHKKRQRDMKAGKGDYTESNAVYKMLANRGLFPQISGVSGEYIAKTAANDWFAPSYMVPDHIKQQLHEWRQGLPWSEGSNLSPYDRFHVTGLYSPTGFSNPEHQAWVQSRSGLTYPVQTIGVESFGAGAKGHPVVLRVHHPQLQEDTERLQDEAEQHGIEVSRHPEGYKPHITLGYSPEPVEGDHPHMTFPVGPLKDLHTYYDESKRAAKTSSAPVKPPNYRHQDKPSEKCGNCKMNNKGHCWGYGNVEIEHNDVCNSWAPETKTAKTASYPTGFQTMFHVSPRKNRESILEHGLKGHEGEHESPWAYTWDQPRGNYLFDNLDDARMYVHGLRQRQHGENRHEYDEERQFEPPEPPPGWKDWPEEKLDEWTQNWYDNAVPSNDDPLGYDIYSVQAHGLPLGQDPESASVAQKRSEDPNLYGDKNPHWDIGRIHDEYERQAEPLMRDGEIGYPDLDELHNEVGSYHGAEPKRYYVPTAIKPSRLALEEHYPLWDVTPESEEALYEDTAPQEVPSPWMQVPFTERPMPGHESKIATRVLYNGFRPDPVHPKGAGSEPTLPFIYDPAEDLVHLGPANSYHHQLIERTPELRAQYGEVGRWTQPPSQSEEGKAHIHGNMEWPSKRVQFQSEVDEDQERAIRQALKAPEPEDGEDPEWGFQSKTAASHLAQKVYAETIAKDGSTYDLQGKPPTTRFGYAPSLHTQTPVHPDQLSPDVIDDFIAAHKDELEEPGKYIGTWLHDGNYVLDVTEGHDDYDTAFERAWNGHQKAMWDGLKNEEIPVRGLDYQQPLAFA